MAAAWAQVIAWAHRRLSFRFDRLALKPTHAQAEGMLRLRPLDTFVAQAFARHACVCMSKAQT